MHEVGPILEPGAVHDRGGVDAGRQRREPVTGRRRRSGSDSAQVHVAEAVDRSDRIAVGNRQLGEHPGADGDHQNPHGNVTPVSSAARSVPATRSAVVPGFSRWSGPRSEASNSSSVRVPVRT